MSARRAVARRLRVRLRRARFRQRRAREHGPERANELRLQPLGERDLIRQIRPQRALEEARAREADDGAPLGQPAARSVPEPPQPGGDRLPDREPRGRLPFFLGARAQHGRVQERGRRDALLGVLVAGAVPVGRRLRALRDALRIRSAARREQEARRCEVRVGPGLRAHVRGLRLAPADHLAQRSLGLREPALRRVEQHEIRPGIHEIVGAVMGRFQEEALDLVEPQAHARGLGGVRPGHCAAAALFLARARRVDARPVGRFAIEALRLDRAQRRACRIARIDVARLRQVVLGDLARLLEAAEAHQQPRGPAGAAAPVNGLPFSLITQRLLLPPHLARDLIEQAQRLGVPDLDVPGAGVQPVLSLEQRLRLQEHVPRAGQVALGLVEHVAQQHVALDRLGVFLQQLLGELARADRLARAQRRVGFERL